jgi:hypothetical protein
LAGDPEAEDILTDERQDKKGVLLIIPKAVPIPYSPIRAFCMPRTPNSMSKKKAK